MGDKPEDTISIDLSKYSIDELSTMDNMTYTYSIGNIAISDSTVSTISNVYTTTDIWNPASYPIIDYNNDSIVWTNNAEEFETHLPSIGKIKEMCEMYPGMKKAFDNFKDIYDLVKDDYEARMNKNG